MPQEIKTLANTASWTEDSTDKSTPRVSHVLYTLDLPGIKGELKSQSIMVYHAAPAGGDKAAGDASFTSADIVVAKDFAGKQGSFVIQGRGSYTAATATIQIDFEILPATGTGDLKNLKGKGSAKTTGHKDSPGQMEYVFLIESL